MEEIGFEAALEALEHTVEELEGGDLGLDAALAKYEQGVRLLSRCYGMLNGAERAVALLTGVGTSGEPETSPFEATATAGRETPSEIPGPAGREAGPSGEDAEDGIPF